MPFIVQEQGCLAGLTSYLDDSDTEVVRMAIEAISLLSSSRSNRKNLRISRPAEKVKKLTTHHNSLIQNFASRFKVLEVIKEQRRHATMMVIKRILIPSITTR